LTMMWILKYMREEPVQSATGERMLEPVAVDEF